MYTLKKSLGQHFLHDENICRKIMQSIKQTPFDQLLEVGPGAGALTKYFIELKEVHFKAVEVDEEKVEYLYTRYPLLKDKIIHQSFLDIEKPFEGKFTVVGNFPYNISSQILFKILEWKEDVECVVGMFQKEVAQRIAAKEGNKTYGVLSVLVQAFFDTAYLFEVSENSFKPPPKVKSAVIRLTPRAEHLKLSKENLFFLLVKTAFNQRRKTLRNAVKSLFDENMLKDEIFDKRAEQLSVNDFAQLTFRMK
ncbi:MAG TPA: 16S rRNA (adenine(1518)-N(6)/adenine(1519)-N(6))-dimethyltransferase RsmA [Puia sp.]|jgi:16S rRNA (adenine1518-N6/adenine1519-N6)-dimethyltransferase|nr:16S rRNA (adenine(1518)-N(6)/adenine(1519)-N(6))-dimethyltransferase RsmA [Puia sp.]